MRSEQDALVILAEKIHGKLAGDIAKLLNEHGEITDDDIAKILKIDVSDVRRTLNLMFEARLVKYRRARDEKIGWYKYFWRLTEEPAYQILEDRKRMAIKVLETRLRYEESNEYFICPKCKKRYTFDEADDYGYTCPECGELLEPYDNTVDIEILKKAIEKLKAYNPLQISS